VLQAPEEPYYQKNIGSGGGIRPVYDGLLAWEFKSANQTEASETVPAYTYVHWERNFTSTDGLDIELDNLWILVAFGTDDDYPTTSLPNFISRSINLREPSSASEISVGFLTIITAFVIYFGMY